MHTCAYVTYGDVCVCVCVQFLARIVTHEARVMCCGYTVAEEEVLTGDPEEVITAGSPPYSHDNDNHDNKL